MFSQGHKVERSETITSSFWRSWLTIPSTFANSTKRNTNGDLPPDHPYKQSTILGGFASPSLPDSSGKQINSTISELRSEVISFGWFYRTWLKPKSVTTAKHHLFIGKNIWYKHYRIDHDHGSIIVYMGNESLNMATAKHHLCKGKNIWYKHYRIDHDHGSINVYMDNESLNMTTAKHHLCLGKNIW